MKAFTTIMALLLLAAAVAVTYYLCHSCAADGMQHFFRYITTKDLAAYNQANIITASVVLIILNAAREIRRKTRLNHPVK